MCVGGCYREKEPRSPAGLTPRLGDTWTGQLSCVPRPAGAAGTGTLSLGQSRVELVPLGDVRPDGGLGEAWDVAHPPGFVGDHVQSLGAFRGLGTITWVGVSVLALSCLQALRQRSENRLGSPGQKNKGQGFGGVPPT